MFSNLQLTILVMYVLNNLCKCLKIQLSEYSLICLNVNDYKDSILLQAINLQLFKIDFFLWLAGIYSSWVVTRCLNVKTVIFTFIASVCLSGNGFDFFQHASQILQFGGQLKEKEMLCKWVKTSLHLLSVGPLEPAAELMESAPGLFTGGEHILS